MPSLTAPITLYKGDNQLLNAAVTATGTAKSQQFVTDPTDGDKVLTLMAKETAITVLTVDVETSPDGGTTWLKHTTALDLRTGAKRVSIGPNLLCRLNVMTITGTSVDIYGSVS